MRKKFPFVQTMYEKEGVSFWSVGYFVSTVGANEEVIQKYIEHQGEEDRGRAKLVLTK
ncbi:transposase, partial [Candidatus Uhrbacteria bacterium]|nr:transposase [Candidatus Uhrbacteria bacterium]MBI5654818.1 transposase [Candidatus Uhrbacteria bacterium]